MNNRTILLATDGGLVHAFRPLPVVDMTGPLVALCGADMLPKAPVRPLYKGRGADITCPTCFAKYLPTGEEPSEPPKFSRNQNRKNSGPAVQGNLF